jgi:hypothetical protein
MAVSRRLGTACAVTVLTTALLTVSSVTQASAKAAYKGPALGEVTCSSNFGHEMYFHPPLRTSSGGATWSFRNIQLRGCSISDLPAGVTEFVSLGLLKGKATAEPDTGCDSYVSGSGNDVVISLKVRWFGSYDGSRAKFSPSYVSFNGFVPSTAPELDEVGFEVPNPNTQPNGGSVTGSFAGTISNESTFYTPETPSEISSECQSAKGVSGLEVNYGSVSIP